MRIKPRRPGLCTCMATAACLAGTSWMACIVLSQLLLRNGPDVLDQTSDLIVGELAAEGDHLVTTLGDDVLQISIGLLLHFRRSEVADIETGAHGSLPGGI